MNHVQMNHSELAGLWTEMDGLFQGLLPWLAGQYDGRSGGFYYARSSREQEGRKPDIESTAQALNILERLGLLGAMPETMRRQMTRFFQQKQDADSGYFLDDDPSMKDDEVMVARAIGYSVNALNKLGDKPLYPLPYEAGEAPAYMSSPESYLQWLRSVDLINSWRGCDRLSCSTVYLKQLEEPERSRYARMALRFFEETQHRSSGLWGQGSLYVRISGTFKLHIFYNSFQTPMPQKERIYASILQALREEEASDMCYIRNPIHLLSYILPTISAEEWRFIVQTTTRNMNQLLRADGGFSRELAHSPSAPNVAQVKSGEYYPDMPMPVHLSEGRVEGDMNAATQALLIRSLCRRLAGVNEEPLGTGMSASFYSQLGLV